MSQQQQQQQQQPVPPIPNFINPQQNQAPVAMNNFPAPQPQAANAPQPQLTQQNFAALLNAFQNAAPQNNAMPNLAGVPAPFNNFQNQIAMMQLNNQINQANANQNPTAPANPSGDGGDGNTTNIEQILNAANAINATANSNGTAQEQTPNSTTPLETNERKPGGTSLARSQRIGLKNSLTRRPNSKQAANPMASSLMDVDGVKMEEETSEDMQEDA